MIHDLLNTLDLIESSIGKRPYLELMQDVIQIQQAMVEQWNDLSPSDGIKLSKRVFEVIEKIRSTKNDPFL